MTGDGEDGRAGEGVVVEVVLFARIRELVGRESLSLRLPSGTDVDGCFRRLAERHSRLAPLRSRVAAAVNEEYASWDRVLRHGDVVTFIPPVSGGGPG